MLCLFVFHSTILRTEKILQFWDEKVLSLQRKEVKESSNPPCQPSRSSDEKVRRGHDRRETFLERSLAWRNVVSPVRRNTREGTHLTAMKYSTASCRSPRPGFQLDGKIPPSVSSFRLLVFPRAAPPSPASAIRPT